MTEQVTDPIEKSVFVVDSEEKANWVLSKMANLEAEKDRIEAQAKARLCAIENELKGLHFRFDAELEQFARQQLVVGTRKSLHLLQGTLAFRTIPRSIKITSLQAAMDHAATEYPALLSASPKLDTDAYRDIAQRALEEAGEILPGVEVNQPNEKFSISFGKK